MIKIIQSIVNSLKVPHVAVAVVALAPWVTVLMLALLVFSIL